MNEKFRPLGDAYSDTKADSMPRRAQGDELTGRVIGERYKIVRRLAEGGMGTVYVAEHLTLGKKVAVKTIHPRYAGDGNLAERFAREAMATGRLEHPHVASAMDYGFLPSGSAYLVMQFVQGESLQDISDREGKLSWARVCHIMAQVADALFAAHSEGIIHRDLKPENIMLRKQDDGTDFVKVLDFGIAALADSDEPTMSDAQRRSLTRQGTVMGTPGYMSPEQALGERVNERADIYTLGTLIWESLIGRQLWEGQNLSDIVASQLSGAPTARLRTETGDATIPDTLQELVDRMLARNPDDRPGSAAEVRDALRALSIHARVTGSDPQLTPVHMNRATGRNSMASSFLSQLTTGKDGVADSRRVIALGAAAVGFLLVLLVVVWAISRPSQTEADERPSEELMQQLMAEAQAQTVAEQLTRHTEILMTDEDRNLRRAAAAWLLDFEPADQVPAYAQGVATLELARGCNELRSALEALTELQDQRAYPAADRFEQMTRRRRRRRSPYSCVRDEAVAAVEALRPEGVEVPSE